MESSGRRALRHPPSTNMSYKVMLYNVEEFEQDVHEPVTVPGMDDMKSQDNYRVANRGFKFLRTRA